MKSANGPGDVLAVRVVDVCLFEYGLAGGWVSLKILWVVRWSRRVHSRVDHPGELLGEAAVQSIDACAVAGLDVLPDEVRLERRRIKDQALGWWVGRLWNGRL